MENTIVANELPAGISPPLADLKEIQAASVSSPPHLTGANPEKARRLVVAERVNYRMQTRPQGGGERSA
jgi:hypothetical protein